MADTRSKALAYLRNGLVTVGVARLPRVPDPDRPDFVSARVQGYHATYQVHLLDGRWSCSCRSVMDDGSECAHAGQREAHHRARHGGTEACGGRVMSTDYEPADEPIPTLVLVGAFLGGMVLAVAGIAVAVRRWMWAD